MATVDQESKRTKAELIRTVTEGHREDTEYHRESQIK
jgi:hypothetical protein